MTKCDMCGKESGKLYCAKCRAKIEGIEPNLDFKDLIPLLYWDKKHKCYRFGCTVRLCPYNRNGVCVIRHLSIESVKQILHEFDGDNICHNFCG